MFFLYRCVFFAENVGELINAESGTLGVLVSMYVVYYKTSVLCKAVNVISYFILPDLI